MKETERKSKVESSEKQHYADLGMTQEEYRQAREKTENIVRAGIFLALIWLLLIAANLIPFMSFSSRVLAACLLLFSVLRLGLLSGILIFIAANALSFAYPGPLQNLAFLIYLGPYVLLAFALNRLSKSRWIIAVRVLLGSGLFLLVLAFYEQSFLSLEQYPILEEYFWPVMFLLGFIGTAVYDYALALVALLYRKHLARYI